jgi:glycosyltransferase involved in cell wall biosynthesis
MRILLTTHAFLPRSLAGVEIYTVRLATALQRLGHDVHVLTATHDLAGAPYSVRRTRVASLDVIEIVNTRLQGTLEATYRVPEIDEAIGEILEELRPECVHAQHLLNLSTGMIPAARRLGACVVLTLHDYWLSCPRDGLRMQADGTLCAHVDHHACAACLASSPYLVPPVQRGAMRLARSVGLGGALHALHRRAPRISTALLHFMRRLSPVRPNDLAQQMGVRDAHLRQCVSDLDAVVAPTRFAGDRALEWGISPAHMRWMPLGAAPAPPRARVARTRRRLGYVGSLSPHKGAHVLIEAARSLTHSDWTLDLFGNPSLDFEYTRRLHRLAAGDARIRFRGLVAAGEQQDLWSSVDLLVVPSLWWENSPLVILEALAAGVPVVASRTGGVPELLSGGAGVLVPPGDAAALRATLEDVLDGRLLAGPLAPLPLKTTEDGARELVALYAELRAARDSAPGGAAA